MAGLLRVACIGSTLILCLAGCASTDIAGWFVLQNDAAAHDRVIAGSLETVRDSTQATLNEIGLASIVTRNGETVRIASKTSTGSRFTVVLTRDKSKEGEHVRVRLEWDGPNSEEVTFQLLSRLEEVSRLGEKK